VYYAPKQYPMLNYKSLQLALDPGLRRMLLGVGLSSAKTGLRLRLERSRKLLLRLNLRLNLLLHHLHQCFLHVVLVLEHRLDFLHLLGKEVDFALVVLSPSCHLLFHVVSGSNINEASLNVRESARYVHGACEGDKDVGMQGA